MNNLPIPIVHAETAKKLKELYRPWFQQTILFGQMAIGRNVWKRSLELFSESTNWYLRDIEITV